MTFSAVIWSSLARLTIIEVEPKCILTILLYFVDSQISEFWNTFIANIWHVRNTHSAFHLINKIVWNDLLTVEDRVKHH